MEKSWLKCNRRVSKCGKKKESRRCYHRFESNLLLCFTPLCGLFLLKIFKGPFNSNKWVRHRVYMCNVFLISLGSCWNNIFKKHLFCFDKFWILSIFYRFPTDISALQPSFVFAWRWPSHIPIAQILHNKRSIAEKGLNRMGTAQYLAVFRLLLKVTIWEVVRSCSFEGLKVHAKGVGRLKPSSKLWISL